ncbi:MAG: lysylphosphatidylglycerol synthase domain-containing protein [Chitinophagaceae bacterium]|nr:flippase-like domain-containing protein [Chitinophagaceae bacterium]HQV05248.1 lysylphosphatidylglycerol synthase domain-containing protein [Chitinophagaceae bacterium]
MKANKNIKFFINYFLGPLLFGWLVWSIYWQIKNQEGLEQAWRGIRESLNSPKILYLVFVLLLMVVNWTIEAIKWRLSIRKIQQVSLGKALQAVLSGVSFAVSTPNRMGEYLGRILYMKDGSRLKTISITIVGSISQLIITLIMGFIGLLLLQNTIREQQLISSLWMQFILMGVVIVIVFLTLFYFRLTWIVRLVEKLPYSRKFSYLVTALEDFNATMLWQLLSLSLLRFFVFIVQYYLLFSLFDMDMSWWHVFWTVSVSFLVMAVIPTIAIAELAQRGKILIAIVGLYTTNELGITLVTASIWFINLIIPAITGSILILRIKKILKEQHEKV